MGVLALKGRNNATVQSPLQGLGLGEAMIPGRCPGMVAYAHSGRLPSKLSRTFNPFRQMFPTMGIALAMMGFAACRKSDEPSGAETQRVVVYCSVDETYARPILDEFQRATGIAVTATFDTEAGKTTGLVNRIIAESGSGGSRADVFWSGEVFNTILLARQGLLEPYDSPAAGDVPGDYRDSQHRWTGTAVRARVVAFDPKRTPAARVPKRWADFAKSEIAPRTAIANPLFGTTRGHMAALFAVWGRERATSFLRELRQGNVMVLDGNSATVRAVAEGRADFGWTDSDDVAAAKQAGWSIESASPDFVNIPVPSPRPSPLERERGNQDAHLEAEAEAEGEGEGTLLIPCTASMLRRPPHPTQARRLVDYLVSADVERELAKSGSRNIPVREAVRTEMGLTLPRHSRVDYQSVAEAMDSAVSTCREILLR